jgi:dephospho-CoA kinase
VAAGKSEALAAFQRLGAAVVSSDEIVHRLLDREPLLSSLRTRWGPDVVTEGRADRSAIGARVFNDPDELAWLEAEVHPLVRDEIAGWFSRAESPIGVAVVEVPLLFEGELAGKFDTTVAITADERVRLSRAGERGQAGLEGRERRQLTQEEKAALADHVVVNDGSVDDLEKALGQLLGELGVAVRPDRPV